MNIKVEQVPNVRLTGASSVKLQSDKAHHPAMGWCSLNQSLGYGMLMLLIALTACSGTRSVRPLARRRQRIDFSFGGPLTKVSGLYVPAPVSSVAYTRGISDRADMDLALHPTAALFGVTILEYGGNYLIDRGVGIRPALTLSPRFFVMSEFKSSTWRFYPDAQLSVSWNLKPSWLFYTGASNFFEIRDQRTLNTEQRYHWLFSPLVGTEFQWGKIEMQMELKWYAANVSNAAVAPDYAGLSKLGAIAPVVSIKKTW